MKHSIRTSDDVTAAGRIELDKLQRELQGQWDVEAGLQEILLEEHYQQAITAPAPGFDVDAGLAEILTASASACNTFPVALPEDHRRESYPTRTVFVHMSYGFEVDLTPVPPTTFDLIRERAGAALRVVAELEAATFESPALVDATSYFSEVGFRAVRLESLADQLEDGSVTLDAALSVVGQLVLALLAMDREFIRLWMRSRTEGMADEYPLRKVVADAVKDVSELREPIRRLFEPSDDMVGSAL
ncbi:hypothetical protein ACGFLT_19665 [Micromonospora chalcea]